MQTAQGFLFQNHAPMPCGARSQGEQLTRENICFAGSLKRFANFRFCWAWPNRVGVPAGGAAALPLPWDLHCCALPALQPRCICAPPCFAKRNKLSERRWAFERHDLGGHAFSWCVRGVRSTRPFFVRLTIREDVFGNGFRVGVRSVVASARAKRVAKNYAFGLRKVCEEVRRKKGAATRG